MQTKLKLDLDQLTVESFDTSRHAEKKGTVFGEQCTCYTQCTCPGCPTCANYNTCDNTCPNTCAYTCDDNTCPYTCDDASCGGGCATIAYTNCFRCEGSAMWSACNGMACP
ncbi:MAG TPA: hypothetical protein VHG93_01620 [Longimicrobium sp.]|nr:hypothetical protein [Longimicrobium sp.]